MSEFPIRVLSEQTGVAATTLRAWERRYGLLKPKRTPKGHRLYNSDDIKMVRQVVKLLQENYTISKAIDAIGQGEAGQARPVGNTSHWVTFRKRFLRAIETFDDNMLDSAYNEALSLYPIDIVTVNLLRPLLVQLGQEWQERKTGIAQEHFFTAYLRNKVGARMHHAVGRNHGKRLILACLPGEYHELGALLFALSAMMRGYRVLYLGADMPLEQVQLVAENVDVHGVLLSGSCSEISDSLHNELQAMAKNIDLPLLLGGSISSQLDQPGVEPGFTLLGSDYVEALATLEALIPAYGI